MSQSAIIIPVLSADSIVGKWRTKYDEVSLHGIPSHITLLFPFKEPSLITQEIIKKIEVIFSKIKQFPFTLGRINTFPKVIFLEPSPRDKFIELTETIARFFPENQPYEGIYSKINPHMTIAQLTDNQNMNVIKEEIIRDIVNALPIKSAAKEAWLMEEHDGEWSIKMKFQFIS